jgi:hypothetical protein
MGQYTNIFKTSFVSGLGSFASLSVSFAIALLFGIPGMILVMQENKKPKSQRNMALLIVGFILMGLGVAFGLGFNSGELINAVKEQF